MSADKINFTPNQLAEQYGSNIAMNALDAMLAAGTQAKRCAILQEALKDLCGGGNEHAAGGFAAALVSVIERGLGVEE